MITLSNDQKTALHRMEEFLQGSEEEFVLRGHAGVGKTTVIQHFLASNQEWKAVLTAPTNKAKNVLRKMATATGVNPDVMTTYSLLGLKMDKSGEAKKVYRGGHAKVSDYDLIIVDEASMINQSLRGFLREAAMMEQVKIIYTGDPLQLPPVGEARSMVFTDGLPGFQLNEIIRQALDNPIIAATEQIRQGIRDGRVPSLQTNKTGSGGIHILPHDKWLHWMSSGFNSATYQDDPDSFRALAWTNRQVRMLNRRVRTVLDPTADPADRFRIGERVVAAAPVFFADTDGLPDMSTDQEASVQEVTVGPHPLYQELFGPVYNLVLETDSGDVIEASAVHQDSQHLYDAECNRRVAEARKDRSKWPAFYEFKELHADLRPCHALTVHRSQGSTYRNTFVHLGDILSNRNQVEALQCLYVAVSRASHNVIITMGDEE